MKDLQNRDRYMCTEKNIENVFSMFVFIYYILIASAAGNQIKMLHK